MKKIDLTLGKETIVDDEDYDALMAWKWHFAPSGYAAQKQRHNGIQMSIYMHRYILALQGELEVDHINGDKLDNRRCNLREATRQQNACNRGIQRNNKCGRKGVRWHKGNSMWQARIGVHRRKIHLGYFHDLEDAADAYRSASITYHGRYTRNERVCELPL